MLMYVVIYYHQIPFYLIRGVRTSPNSPHFASFQQKCLENFFWPWGYAYVLTKLVDRMIVAYSN